MGDQIDLLFEEYKKSRHTKLDREQFAYLTKLYPALLICMSDGVLDDEEWEGIVMATKGLAEEFVRTPEDDKDQISMAFRMEFRYLIDNIEKWQKKFLNALNDSIKDNPSDKEFVLECMYLFANAADGISDEERDKIDVLARRLNLED
ncbi:MAG: hypothetical protein NWS46_10635 [Cyclobacteriaceae bacterium]|jgi:tellurite resistance protein|nr:hypothetical protein [Cyclobacteriaceae bacterium]